MFSFAIVFCSEIFFNFAKRAAADRQHFRLLLILRLNFFVDLKGNCGVMRESERKICVKIWYKSQRAARTGVGLTRTVHGFASFLFQLDMLICLTYYIDFPVKIISKYFFKEIL